MLGWGWGLAEPGAGWPGLLHLPLRRMAPPQGAVAALMAAYFANEIGAEYGLLSQAHYDMTHECLQRRQRAKTGSALTAEQEEAIGQAATRTMVAQSTLAAVLEFCLAQLAGQLSDAVGRRPILVAASLLMAVCKAVPALRPSVPGVWAAKAGGEALNTICTNALLSSVSDLFADSVQAYGATAGRLRALGVSCRPRIAGFRVVFFSRWQWHRCC